MFCVADCHSLECRLPFFLPPSGSGAVDFPRAWVGVGAQPHQLSAAGLGQQCLPTSPRGGVVARPLCTVCGITGLTGRASSASWQGARAGQIPGRAGYPPGCGAHTGGSGAEGSVAPLGERRRGM
uniref:P.troglodytes triose-phosphate isomerase (TPI) protein n=1 Tax=Pan troglodytes TaxID=9598 RepID=V9GZJ7_PANTR|nr:hypothetical 12.4K protein (TPI 3' region) - chimpanzee [Pan troglodytes]AAA35440.1 putative [Pan troglodytes]